MTDTPRTAAGQDFVDPPTDIAYLTHTREQRLAIALAIEAQAADSQGHGVDWHYCDFDSDHHSQEVWNHRHNWVLRDPALGIPAVCSACLIEKDDAADSQAVRLPTVEQLALSWEREAEK